MSSADACYPGWYQDALERHRNPNALREVTCAVCNTTQEIANNNGRFLEHWDNKRLRNCPGGNATPEEAQKMAPPPQCNCGR